jgi:hypothetical protein
LWKTSKAAYGLNITDSGDLFLTEKNLLEFLMKLGRAAMGNVFQQLDTGYEGAVIRKEQRKYKFVGYRTTSLHGLFGMIDYKRAYWRPPDTQADISTSETAPRSTDCRR